MPKSEYPSTRSLFKIDPEMCNETLRQALLSHDEISEVEIPTDDLGCIIVTATITPKKVLKYIHKYTNTKGKKSWSAFKKSIPKPKPSSPPSSYGTANDDPNNPDQSLNPPPPPYYFYNSHSHMDNPPLSHNPSSQYESQYFGNYDQSQSQSFFDNYPPHIQSQSQYFADNYPPQVQYSSSDYYPSQPQPQPYPTMEYQQPPPPPQGYETWGSYHYSSDQSGSGSGSGYGYGNESNEMPSSNNMGGGGGGGASPNSNENPEGCFIM